MIQYYHLHFIKGEIEIKDFSSFHLLSTYCSIRDIGDTTVNKMRGSCFHRIYILVPGRQVVKYINKII